MNKMDGFDINKIVQDTVDAIGAKIHNLKKLNIIVAGKTGVGKSTLINSVFKEKFAETGVGKPITDHMRKITKNGVPLSIYDTQGFELGKEIQDAVKKEISDTIDKGLKSQNINDTIHCIWYCINTMSNRVESEEIQWLRELSMENQVTQVPIIVVLTQAIQRDVAQKMRKIIMDENLDIRQVIPVLAEDFEIEGLGVVKAYGLDNLIKVMAESLPEELIDTLQHVQIASLNEKKKYAQIAVSTAVAAVTAAGAAPVPFSDCFLLVPAQITMIASITVAFGLNINKGTIYTLISSTIGTGGATILGKTVTSNLLKLIPGAGTIVGGFISGSTAAVITLALGEAYIGIMEKVFNGEMSINEVGTQKGKTLLRNLFQDHLKKSN